MNGSGKRISGIWGFASGIVLGALTMLALTGAHAARPAAEAAARQAVRTVEQSAEKTHEAVADPGEERRLPGHSELSLQLD